MIIKKISIIVLGLLLIGGGWWVINKSDWLNKTKIDTTNPEVSRVRKNGVLIVGADATFFPMEYLDEKGKVVGFGPDFAVEIAKGFGVPVEMKNVTWDNIFKELDEGKIDLIISSVTITTERSKKMLFSKPYFSSGQVVVLNKANSSIRNLSDLKDKKIGVQMETTGEIEAVKIAGAGNVVKYSDYDGATNDLISGKIDAMVIDYPSALGKVKTNPTDLKLLSGPFTQEFWGVVVAKGKEDLLIPVNGIIEKMIDSGEIKELEDKWLK